MKSYMQTRIVNVRDEPYDVYIGRGGETRWSNPYSHIRGKSAAIFKTKTRQEAIDLFEKDLRFTLKHDLDALQDFLKLNGKTLGCHCKPKSCHGDVIIKILSEYCNASKLMI
jgi:hypothetical protein